MEATDKVRLHVDVHPRDYQLLQSAAERTGMPIGEFCALTMHLGVRETLSWGAIRRTPELTECVEGDRCDRQPATGL
ncbi:hypothetical protein E2P84_42435 [Burkholderia cepacia]|uniref:CopG family transcriptional regulator n=1 Tax=Burkholderia cepacia TaxID=292 RepID=A0AAX2RRZ4_BURCE|nr:hypothetical protein [Burkholderia cepacia]TES62183.1 hypothetical protein E2P84_42435 [Burkholderia cepacia]TET01625.1 hypothetical protein E3D36_16450 [Burkholderia cepacia]TEU47483.1 hypothetical protein E3D37_15880 [Burkholderia cepacia]TEU53510.1 hypothetical protein E3D38_12270 [Burkholderia cepacia]TEV02116.1 hypothetical protein E3D40_13200 [Burkholderia cepacia]